MSKSQQRSRFSLSHILPKHSVLSPCNHKSTGKSFCSSLSALEFERISEETLESLCEKFEELNELDGCPSDFDVTYAGGVLTANIGGGKI